MRIDKTIISAIILFTILLLIYFLVYPEYQKFRKLQIDLGIKKAEYTAEFEYYAQISKIYHELKTHEEDLKIVDSALPSDPNLGKLIYFFQNQTEKNGLILKSIFLTKSSASSTKNTKKELSFSLSFMGTYSSLENFISSLEKSARIVEITNISFGSGGKLESSGQTQFQSVDNFSFSMQVKTNIY